MNSISIRTAFFSVAASFLLFWGCNSSNESDRSSNESSIHVEASSVEISWDLLSNFGNNDKLRASLTLHNTGSEAFPANDWVLYFNSLRNLDTESFLPEIKATHINGDLFKLEPSASFEGIPAGENFEIEYLADFHAIKVTDAPKGFYFVFDDDRVETVENVKIQPFEGNEQVNRNEGDHLAAPTAESQFRENELVEVLPSNQIGKVTPQPTSVSNKNGSFDLTGDITIRYAGEFSSEADYLSQLLNDRFDIDTSTEESDGEENDSGIILKKQENNFGEEAYTLTVSGNAIEISANDGAGIFYGIQSLRSLIANRNKEALQIPAVEIEDHPQFEYRGMHLDVARNFQPKESVLRLLDVMGMYKMNKFHFHLTDDEGWRIAINELPELVEVGGRRGHTESEDKFLAPAYGSGPDPTPGKSFGSGWFSQDEYKEILKFADERHIEVIPEIDVPGHARAAIKAMEVRYNRLQELGDMEQAEMYRLEENEDESEYLSVQSYDDNVMNVCQQSTYRFLGLVFDEIQTMHEEAGVPLNMIHVGGDEVPHGAWEGSPTCKQYMEENSLESVSELPRHFFSRLQQMLEERGLKMAGWEEVAMNDSHDSPNEDSGYMKSVVPYVWSSIWGSGREDYAYMLANAGYKVVMSNASNLYLDMAYDKSWQEPGFYWAAMFGTKETYSFIPFDLYKNADHDNNGNPMNPAEYDNAIQLTAAGRENVLGIQGQLWSETITEPHRWEYMVLPRLLGLAERAWVGNPSWGSVSNTEQRNRQRDKTWNEFANRLGNYELNRLSQNFEGIQYRVPVAGAIIENGIFKANSQFPGLIIRYEINGTVDNESPIYNGHIEVSDEDSVTVAIFNSKGRAGRAITVQASDSD